MEKQNLQKKAYSMILGHRLVLSYHNWDNGLERGR